jgi:DNA-binding transcriptional MerR regulator
MSSMLDYDVASYHTLVNKEEKTMKTWYAKELSNLSNVSVRTLHYYDKIDLLKPSIRQSNNYRLYSEKDLLKLQQIVALKFFGFKLSQIKRLLSTHVDMLDNLALQSNYLQQKANALSQASHILKRITKDCNSNTSIPWQQIIQLIEVYHMTKQLEHSWVTEIFNQDELQQYAQFEAEMKSNATPESKAQFENDWANLVQTIEKNLKNEPNSEIGIKLGKRCMDLINGVYGKKYAHLRTKKFEKGFGEGKGLDEVGLTKETVAWLEKAMDAYWHDRIHTILDKVDVLPSSELKNLWTNMADELYGNDENRKAALITTIDTDTTISQKVKDWLKSL